jgi:hypothetical protein
MTVRELRDALVCAAYPMSRLTCHMVSKCISVPGSVKLSKVHRLGVAESKSGAREDMYAIGDRALLM